MFVSHRPGQATGRRVRAALARLPGDTRGAALIEFAMVAAPLIALLIAILQTSLTFFAQQTLETTAEKSARQLMTGEAQNAGMNATKFKASVCEKLPGFMKCAKTFVDVSTTTYFSNVATSAPTIAYDSSGNPKDGAWNPGTPGQITIVKIMYIWDATTGPLGFDLSNLSGNKRLLISTSVFKTEPYEK